MQIALVTFKPNGERRSFAIKRETTVIGRREDCDVRIPLGDVSRKHCRLIVEGESLRVEDLNSSNGTYLNGVRIQDAVAQPGDTLQVGSVVFTIQINGIPADEEIQPVAPAGPGDDTSVRGAAPSAGEPEPPLPESPEEAAAAPDEPVDLNLQDLQNPEEPATDS